MPKVSPLTGLSYAPTDGLWAFRSRPDLTPPVVQVTKKARNTAPGYVFVAPEAGDAGQGGSLIVDNEGQVVWFRPLRHPILPSSRAMNFEVQTYRGNPVLTWGETPGEYVIFDDSYQEIARFTAGNDRNGDHHEFLISPQDTALITIFNAVPQDLTSVGGAKDSVAMQGIVQELDIETGEVLFEWQSIDHVALEETYVSPAEDHYPGIDYFHLNSIDVEPDNNLLISARETSAVYKIDRQSGEIIWRLGGKKSDFEMQEGTRFAFQHDARRQEDGTITIFDNGAAPRVHEESRGITVELDEDDMTATLVRVHTSPDELLATSQGNMQVLPNGNVFIGWGSAAHVSEFSPDGKLLFDAHLPPRDDSYRGFRFPWSAHPTDDPDVAVEQGPDGDLALYASWNGATEVATWEVLAGQHPDKLESLGAVPRDGFETALLARTNESYIAVRAKDSSGRVLGTSRPVESGS
jgi:Arylsulfotransferase (ASST)